MTDNQIIIWRINGRGCLAVTGVEAEAFLNDLLTLDMATITADQVVPAILLTPQGRIIFDLLISRIPDGYRLECDEHRLDDLIKKLRLYRLRRDIALTPLDEPVFALAVPDHVDGWLRDSRFRDITASRYYGMPRSDQAVRIADDNTAYHALRFRHGIPEGSAELPAEKALPLEAGMDRQGAISFNKGCFIGQEVTARTRYRGLLKRRYIPFVATTDIAVPADIHANDKLAGETLAIIKDGDGWIGLANIRLDALDTGQTLMVGTDQIIPLTVAESTTKA